jgi:hypothetical protein
MASDNGDNQKQSYGNEKPHGEGKQLGISTFTGAKGGDKTTTGPTGSARDYPKGSLPKLDAARMNPMNCKGDYGYMTDGVGVRD